MSSCLPVQASRAVRYSVGCLVTRTARRQSRLQVGRGRRMPTIQRHRYRDQRLRRKSDFDAVFRSGIRESGGVLALRVAPRTEGLDDDPCRFGFAISSRLGGAVVRNRIRRRLRESVRRLNKNADCRGLDVVVIARNGAAEADFGELDSTLRRLVGRSVRQLRPLQQGRQSAGAARSVGGS